MLDIDRAMARATHLQREGRLLDAEVALLRILKERPQFATANIQLGLLYQARGLEIQGMNHLQTAVDSAPDNWVAHFGLAVSYKSLSQYDKAVKHYETSVKLNARNVDAYNDLGVLYEKLRQPDEAETSYRKALALDPGQAVVWNNLGVLLTHLGRLEEARDCFRRSVAILPGYYPAHYNLATFWRHHEIDDQVEVMRALFAQPNAGDLQVSMLGFALGKVFEELGDYEQSLFYLKAGNAAQRRLSPHDIGRDIKVMSQMIDVMQTTYIGNYAVEQADITPIFIVSMPRSGSTLTEQILASHPDVTGGGELNNLPDILTESGCIYIEDFAELDRAARSELGGRYLASVRSIAKGRKYVTDKLPTNFMRIGIIRMIMPHAKIIHCTRDPMATCFSCYKTRFDNSELSFTNDLRDLGKYYRKYAELMDFWGSTMPGRIHAVRYEELVADPEPAIRDLLSFCELDFDERCLEFYRAKSNVRTASAAQVRDPIHTKSVEAWRKYRYALGPLESALRSENPA